MCNKNSFNSGLFLTLSERLSHNIVPLNETLRRMELMMIEALSLKEEANVSLTAGWRHDEQIRRDGDMRVTADHKSIPPSAKPS